MEYRFINIEDEKEIHDIRYKPRLLQDIRLMLAPDDYRDEYKKLITDIQNFRIRDISDVYFFTQRNIDSVFGESTYPVTILHVLLYQGHILERLHEVTEDFYLVYFSGRFAYHVSDHQNVQKFLQDVNKHDIKLTNEYKQ